MVEVDWSCVNTGVFWNTFIAFAYFGGQFFFLDCTLYITQIIEEAAVIKSTDAHEANT